MIRFASVTKTYRLGAVDVTALKEVNLEIAAGEFVSVMGPSGSGKSTLLHLIGCLDLPSRGEVFIDGVSISTMKDQELTLLRRRKIGFIFQFFNLIPLLSAAENVALPLLLEGKKQKEIYPQVAELLDTVGLSARKKHLPDELSGGERQRVAIARALVNNPPLILADEPTGNLDSATGKEIMELFKKVAKQTQKTVIMVTHDLNVAAYGDRVIRLKDGQVADAGKEA